MEQENNVTVKASPVNSKKSSWRRWFRRTDVYIAEYILMLWLFGAFVGILVGLWFSFFQMIGASGQEARDMAKATAMALGGLIVMAPASYWLYARVTGQEMVQPELHRHRVRTVFLTLWMIGAVGAIVGLCVFVLSQLSSIVFGYADDAGKTWVSDIAPAILAVLTITFAVFAIVKRATRKFAMVSGIVLAVLAVALLAGNVVMVLAKRDSPLPKVPAIVCTFDNYIQSKCTYSQYLQQSGENSSSGNSPYQNNSIWNGTMPNV